MEKSLKNNRTSHIIILLFIIIALSIVAIEHIASLKNLSFFSLVNTFIVFVIVSKVCKSMFSVSSMFMLFLAVFHFGQAWLYAFGGHVDKTVSYDIFSIYSEQNIYNTLLFSLFAFNFIVLFWLLFYKEKSYDDAKNKVTNKTIDSDQNYDRSVVFLFGVAFFLVLLIPVCIYDYLCVTITSEFGHSGLYDNSGALARWAAANSYFPLAIIMLLLGCNPKRNNWKWIYYYAVGRCLLLMILTGKRGSFVIPLLLYVFCKHKFIKKYEKKHFVWIFTAGFLLLSIISFVSYGRGDYSNIDFFQFVREKNIIVQILSELGGSFTTTVLSYKYALSNGFLEGKSYLGALSVFFPMSDTLFASIKEYMSVSALLNPYSPSGGALGGSLFGEMYINFGYYALLLSPLYAWVVSKVENVISNASKHSMFTVCSSIYISYGLWIYVRGNLVDVVFIVKRTLYVLILFFLFKKLLCRRRASHESKAFDSV